MLLGILLAWPAMAAAGDLGSAQLLIAGSRLTVSPESQTVPFDTPTIVETHLEGYDTSRGTLPADLRVLADLTGPEVDGVLVLETTPNQPFRIPRLRLQGEYRLDNIRLMQGSTLLAYAAPRSSSVLVTQVLITKVTSRALTLDEIRSYGIVVDDSSFQAFNFTFAFAVAGETVNYNVPVIYQGPASDPAILWEGPNYESSSSWRSSSARFEPPRMAPFQLQLAGKAVDDSNGGCEDPEGDCVKPDVIPIPGVILFPTDISLLHQFFSVVLLAQNGAPAGDRLTIRDLTAKVTLPPGLRQAKTDPPTALGVPVPVRVPGPDGKLGTADDITFLVAQATGQAEVEVEGLSEGTHLVQFDLEGILEGLPGGQISRITGQARGAVIVRDPTLNVTITHPDTVRTDEEYTMLLTVTNTGNVPANQLKVRLPAEKLSGVQVVGESEKTVTVQPGDAEILDFRLRSRRTGRVTATAARSDSSSLSATFDLTVGVGENGIPLSPNAIILPRSTDSLPSDLMRNGLNLIGLGFSLATAPPALLKADQPRLSRALVDGRIYAFAQAGKQVSLGEDLFDSAAVLAAEWTGVRDADWDWDLLRRTTQKGAQVGASLGTIFAAEAAAHSPQEAFDRFAKTTGYLPAMEGALATGAGVTLEVTSRTNGLRLAGDGNDSARLRALPFADLYSLGNAQMALLAVPEEGGYRARVRASVGGPVDLHLLVPGSDGALRMVRWTAVQLSAGGTATVDFRAADSSFTLAVDTQGDGTVDDQIAGSVEVLQRRPFQAIAAVQNVEVDPSGHVVDVLFSADVDPRSLIPSDARKFTIPGKVSNGGSVKAEQDVTDGAGNTVHNPFDGLRNTRIVRVVFNNPLSPYTTQSLTVSGVKSPLGEQVTSATVQVQTTGAQQGTQVAGTVYGSDGLPVPFAQVELRESDPCLFCEEECRTHKTAVVQADAAGHFLFDYVRQTGCSDVYQLKAIDAASGESGTATGRVRFVAQVVQLNVVMLGRGTVRGRVTYDDGTVPPGARVIAESPVFRQGRSASLDANGNYSLSNVAVGTITLSATDGQGRFTVTTLQIPDAGSVVTHDLVILRQPDQPVATGGVRGVIYRPDGTTPVSGAYVALYVDGNLVGVKHSAGDGTFDFGLVPAGRGEVETFEGATGQSGVQVFFDIKPDQVNQVNLVMQDQRGVVQGKVYRKSGSADPVPVFGAVVWAEGTPFQTVTGPDGFYKLEGVYTGTRNISAADPQKKVKVTEAVTVGAEGQVVDRDLYFQDTAVSGIAGQVLGFDGSPVAGATVHLANGDQYWFRTATTDSSGHFLISDLGVGSYGVHAFKGAAGGSQGTTVRFAGDTPFVTIQFKKGAIHGVVRVNTNGTPVGTRAVITYRTTTVRLELVGLDLESHTLETNADGTFDLPDVLAGPYVITATNAFYGSKTVRGTVAGDGTESVEVTFDGTATGTVRGVVLAPDGVTPVSGATVKLRHPSFSIYDLTTGADGSFDFELVPPVAASFPVEVTASDGVIFRQAQAWVQLNKPGQELDLEIVLPKQGSISGQVQDANGTPVPGAVVTLQEGSYPRRNLIVNADAGGNFAYQNVFAGTVTLSAKAPALGGLGGKTTTEITAEGQEVTGVVISLEPTGGIAGLVTSPVDGSAVPSAEVHLMRGGRLFDTVTAGPDGRFEFSLLPLASYDVTAFDPRTGRFGRRLGVAVIANVTAAGDLQLEARGSVTGHLYEAGTTAGVPGGTIRLQAYSITGFTTYSSTDADGVYEFQGIPQGKFDLFGREPVGRRRATGRGEIVSEGQQVTVDLYLDPQAILFGSVLNPIGAADGVFPNANTVIYQDGQIIGATLDSNYSFPGVVVGRPYELYAQEVGGPHQGQVLGTLTQDGQVRVDVRMHPLGSVVINVVDSFGHPVPGAHVDLWDQGFYGDYTHSTRFQGDTGSDNSITFQTVGEGKLSVYVTDPVTGLKGSAGGWLTQEGQIVELNVALQNSAAITGHTVLADGTTPAAQALVAVQAGGLTLTVYTDDAGAFTLSSIPLGSYLLVLEEHLGPGTREARGNLTANGQVLDLGTLVLDTVDPQVVGVTPAPGAVDVSRNATVTVRFSEPMDTVRDFANNMVRLFDAAGNGVATDNVWQDGDTAMLMTPRQPLANASIFQVRVDRSRIFDKAGRQLTQGVQTTFTTADQVPPAVIAVTPANNARQVPLASPVKVTFSEVVNPSTLSGSALQLTDVTAGAGVTTTFLADPTNRTVTVTPATGLVDGHRYQLTVQGVADTVGNAMTVPFSTAFQALDATAPAITVTSPAEGAQATSGDRLTVSADVTDLSAVTGVTLRAGTWVLTKTAAPYSWQIPAPAVTTAGPVSLQVEAVDEWGNRATATRTLQVSPRANANAPQVAILCLPGSVPPGLEMAVPFHASDDESVASYRLLVNGQETASVPLADQASVDSSFLWTVPASAQPGDAFTLRIEATDFAGNVGTAEAAVTVAAGTLLTASRTLDVSFAGQALVLSQGTFTLTAPLRLSALTLTRGARLTAAAGSRLDLTVDGRLDVGCDASIDASKLGFAGGTGQHTAGYAPDGVTGSQGDSGGSHGGVGDQGGATGAPGAVYDGVYQPALGGAGGAFYNNQLGSKAGAGGGVISLTAGELVLEGRIVAQGETRPASSELGGGGAGGAVSVRVTTLRGGGSIEASGGDAGNCSAGAGGGGRVALQAGSLSGFDPGTQVKAWGGTHPGCNGLAAKYAAPGTVYVVDSTSTYGRLIVDAGQAGGADRTGPATELPALGTGAVTAWSVAGADAWVSAAAPFKPEWLGAWMVLKDGSGTALGGGFKVVEIDAQGRARLAGAAAVSGAAAWSGEYRFDSVDLRHGAGLRSTTPVSGQEVLLQGDVAVTGDVTAVNVTVQAGARVHPVTGGTMRFHVGGRMTVESGAVLDVRNLGYAGGEKVHHPAGYGPAGLTTSQPSTGGSHGGAGGAGVSDSGSAGAVFDSVYEPGLGGGGGGVRASSFYGNFGGAGGGLVAIDAAELDLEGQILASGETRPNQEWGGGGAGGTVAVQAGTLRGAGSIDVSGGDASGCGNSGGGGGGGRVALQVQTFAGFDPSAQVKAWGGVRKDCEGTINQAYSFGAAGTIYAADSTSTYGRLILDAGQQNGADRTGVATELPELAGGAVAGFQADGTDAWVTAAAPFQPEWLGAWMTLQDAAGAPLGGGFQVAEIDAQGRARLAGAGGVSGAASYRGEYRFDTVALSHGAGLWSRSPVTAQDMTLAGTATMGDGVSAGSLTVLAGAVVRPVSGQTLHLKTTGTLTVQAGGRLDVTGLGYPGSGHSNVDGGSPSGVQGAQGGAGGGHGGTGATAAGASANGEVYDSLFTPALGGGGGSYAGIYYSLPGVAGGGAVQIEAGTLDLEGEIRARGVDDDDTANAAGAGGAVWITAGALTGAGKIDASGGFARSCFYQRDVGSGGGGRVALSVGAFTGFDPVTQVLAQGGGRYNCDRSSATYAAPGTVFSKLPSQTYGALRVDQGAGATGSPAVASTALPRIGRGTVGAVTAAGSDLWITPADATAKFSLGVPGMWVTAGSADYLVTDESADRRQLRLAGAAGHVAVGDAYHGVYKLDALSVAGGARLVFGNDVATVTGATTVDPSSSIQYADYNAPAVTISQPSATTFTAGDPITAAATASDDVAVSQVTFSLGGSSFTDSQSPYQWSTSAPPVATATDLDLRAEATDSSGNVGVATRTLHIQPLAPTTPPSVSFLYPGAGGLLPVGVGLDLQLQATDDRGVQRVELYVDNGAAPVTVLTAAPYTYHLSAPAGVVDGQILNLRAVAYDYSLQTAEATVSVRVVQGTVISQSQVLSATDTSLDNTTVILSGSAILTVTGSHTFRDLVVLNGTKVTHPATTAAQEYHLDLTIQRDLFVAQGGTIDVSGRGYLGGSGSQRAYGYGNVQTEGANPGIGGSHGGRGGSFDGSGPVYGSFYDPSDPGAGGGASTSYGGASGGGVVRVTVTGNVVIDGTVLANGASGALGAGGAGGSIRLNGAAIRGAGSIQASGTGSSGGTYGGGSGGRIALYAATIDSGLVSRTVAAGAKTPSNSPATWGAAGTVFVKPDSQTFGDLILDNAGTASSQLTELLPVGSGVIDAVSADGLTFTDNEADFRHILGAADAVFNGDLAHPCPIAGNDHHGKSLILKTPLAATCTALPHVNDTYQGLYRFNRLIVRNGAQGIARDTVTLASPNTPEVASGSSWSSGYAPSLQITSPAAGSSFTSGANVPAAVSVTDALGVANVAWSFASQSSTVTSSPYSWTAIAPEVTQATDFQLTATATDLSGNRLTASQTVHVNPAVDPAAPLVTLVSCGASGVPNSVNPGDLVAPGVAIAVPFVAVDDQAVQSYSLVVDGTTVQTVGNLNQASVSASLTWTPPANTAPGTTFNLRVEARDYSGKVGSTTLTLSVPTGTVLTGTQSLTSAVNGQPLILGGGTFTVQQPISPTSLRLLSGARVVGAGLSGATVSINTTPGALIVQCGAVLDMSALGYTGSASATVAGGAPAGVTGSASDSGGSHGGTGQVYGNPGPAGAVFDSVYQPQLGGGGGSLRSTNTGQRHGGNGGGLLILNVGQLVLDGQIWSKGEQRTSDSYGQSSGAGGSVQITAGTLSGSGLIDVSGGDYQSASYYGASGGGGRVALYVGSFSGFDPVTQVKAWGGTTWNNTTARLYAGPGTVFVKTAADTYGRLIVDSGKETGGVERVGPQTPLPSLGTGAVTAFQAQGADAWVSAAAAFNPQWLGAWMALVDASGASLGSFQVQSIDTSGRVKLTGAGGVTGAAQYRGQYRFDRLDLVGGSGVTSGDELIVGNVYAESKGRLPVSLTATNLTVKAGASPVTVAQGGTLSLTVSGTLTVESGAVLDMSALGYAGSASATVAGGAPAGVTGSASDSGGSHGGTGQVYGNPGPAGAVFDSVYQPQLGGGGGSLRSTNTGQRHGGNGGGVVALNVGQLVLDGQIWSKGEQRSSDSYGQSSGAGGGVQITAGTLSGAGLIDVSGGDYQTVNGASGFYGASGGGGRVALTVGSFSGFDPVTQVKAWGGTTWNGTSPLLYAGPGTVFVKTSSDTYGRLIVDSGKETSGAERVGLQTPLPSLGTGAVTAFQAQGADAWVSASAAFKQQWLGAWMALVDASGASLGSFQVQSIDASGRVLLTGAGGATGAAQYRGQYRFDRLDLKGGAGVTSGDELIVGDVYAESKGRLPSTLTATNVTIKTGASPVTIAQGGMLSLTVSGTLTVESGAVLDVSALGYAGSSTWTVAGGAPAWVAGSLSDSGGSHGGTGQVNGNAGPAGAVFDSVYQPQLGGGAGSLRSSNSARHGGNGGGVVALNVGQLVLDGQIWSKGEQRTSDSYGQSSGAGGSVQITAGTLSGAGLIDVSGGDYQAVSYYGASGGGGRVALTVGSFSGFDPVTQVKAWGGTTWNGTSPLLYAGPGTVFVKTSSDTYGRLIVDSGKETSGAERVGPQTSLPSLGTGAVTAFQAQGADAWVSASAAFKQQWLGAWMALVDASGASLGSFQVQSIDASGRVLLTGAGGATGAAQYRGQYRFDRLDLKGGAGVTSGDELIVGNVYAESKGRLPVSLTATNLTVKAGASPVTVAQGGTLSLTVSGTLTVESGAVLDVSALGYAGSTSSTVAGGAPAGVAGSLSDSGGSHGGTGQVYGNVGPAGAVFDSVYQPQLGGGAGSLRSSNSARHGGNGGGVLTLNVGQLVLNGQIWSKGEQRSSDSYGQSSGAGGSVLITVGTLSGTGLIDVSGGDYQSASYYGASGGGGRVVLYVDTLSGFDPATQVKAWGGTTWNNTTPRSYASPGTIFVKLPSQTYGNLYVDQGGIVAGKAIPNTVLPTIGTDTVGTATADTLTPTALWITPSGSTTKFSLGVIGMWVKVNNVEYRVVDQSSDRRQVLLAGAVGAVNVGDAYRGVYHFNQVLIRGGATLQFLDDRVVDSITLDSTSHVIPSVP
ncbi:MAG TPA: carboxypeptidase regulatory-like domain-containing protein [Thermoanaerobaculia bacterium]